MRILAIDPSGSFKEGKGTTGWVVLNDWEIEQFGQIKAKNFKSRVDYWHCHGELPLTKDPDQIVIEEFVLYGNKSSAQINSEMETSKLLGYLEMHFHSAGYPVTTQRASQAKQRYTDKILLKKGFVTKKNNRYYINGVNVSGHIIDALRHGLYYKLKSTIGGKK